MCKHIFLYIESICLGRVDEGKSLVFNFEKLGHLSTTQKKQSVSKLIISQLSSSPVLVLYKLQAKTQTRI